MYQHAAGGEVALAQPQPAAAALPHGPPIAVDAAVSPHGQRPMDPTTRPGPGTPGAPPHGPSYPGEAPGARPAQGPAQGPPQGSPQQPPQALGQQERLRSSSKNRPARHKLRSRVKMWLALALGAHFAVEPGEAANALI